MGITTSAIVHISLLVRNPPGFEAAENAGGPIREGDARP